MADEKQSLLPKLAGLIAALVAAWAAQAVLSAVWKAASGHKPPKPEDPGAARLAEVVTAAALTGALVALARVLVGRGTARWLS